MNQTLTQANFMTSLRYFLTMGITYAAGKGWISTDTATNVGVLALALLPFAWSMYSNYADKKSTETQVTNAVKAGVSMANDDTVATPPPASIGPMAAKAIVAAYAPTP